MPTMSARPESATRDARRGLIGEVGSMSDGTFNRLVAFAHEHSGLRLSPAKKTLLEVRVRKRLKDLGMASYDEYCSYLLSPAGLHPEVGLFIDAVTTHKTDFFREPRHFEYLTGNILPAFLSERRLDGRELKVWSAACSTGEEPYTIAMVLADFAASLAGLRFTILATDISTRVLDLAKTAIYDEEKTEPVPPELRKKYLLRSRDRARNLVRISPEIRGSVNFRQVNLLEPFRLATPLDVIFCRNALIYFEREAQERLIQQFYEALAPGGYLLVGHSETLSGLRTRFLYEAATIYKRPGCVNG